MCNFRYTLMLHCWEREPQNRPTFSNFVESLSQSLEAMADYMDIGAFGEVSERNLSAVTGTSEYPAEDEDQLKEQAQRSDAAVDHESLEVMIELAAGANEEKNSLIELCLQWHMHDLTSYK